MLFCVWSPHEITLYAVLCVVSSLDNEAQVSHSAVSIRILDVNDNPPELATPYETSICEDAKPGQVRAPTAERWGGIMVFTQEFGVSCLRGWFQRWSAVCLKLMETCPRI